MKLKRFIAMVSMVAMGSTSALLLPTRALAAGECNGFINISYPDFPAGPSYVIPPLPAPLTMRINLGTGSITGGVNNTLTVRAFTLDLACDSDFPLLPGCVPDGPPTFLAKKVDFIAMTQATCGGSTFTPTIITTPQLDDNQVTFTANPPLVIPKDQPTLPGFCSIEFTLQVLQGFSDDSTPGDIEEVVGYKIANCDNGVLVSAGSQTSDIQVSPPPPEDFSCYETKMAVNFDPTNPNQVDPIGSLADTFGKYMDVQPVMVRRVCAPAAKAAVPPPGANGEHYVGYELGTFGSSTFKPVKGVQVQTQQFGGFTLDVVGIASRFPLLVPSFKNKDGTKNPPPPAPDLNPSNHFMCYDTANLKGASIPTAVPQVTDQFGTEGIVFKNRKNWRLCVPTNKNGGDPAAETNQVGLFCLVAQKDRASQNPVQNVFVSWANQIEPKGNHQILDNIDDFCVTATVIKP